jgi:uridine phosphorylase
MEQGRVPAICVFDPDGDLVDYLRATDRSHHHRTWACYHTTLDTFVNEEIEYGIVGRVVGAPFATLVAEELFVSGCELLISITSAGQVVPVGRGYPQGVTRPPDRVPLPYMILIERALRDEGTSYHYMLPSPFSYLHPALREMICTRWDSTRMPLHVGASWTTDAPFRETEEAIAACRTLGILAVEMEASALYALASAGQKPIVCFAHVTNQMGQTEGDFEKGQAQGSTTILEILSQTARAWHIYKSSLW